MLLPWTQRTLSYRNGLKSFVLTHIGLHGDHLPPGDPHQPSQCSHQLHLDNVVQVHPESCVIPQTVMSPPLVSAPSKFIVTMLKPAWEDEVKPTERGCRGHVTRHDSLRAVVCSQ